MTGVYRLGKASMWWLSLSLRDSLASKVHTVERRGVFFSWAQDSGSPGTKLVRANVSSSEGANERELRKEVVTRYFAIRKGQTRKEKMRLVDGQLIVAGEDESA
jgi:hypothetical protein